MFGITVNWKCLVSGSWLNCCDVRNVDGGGGDDYNDDDNNNNNKKKKKKKKKKKNGKIR